MQEVLILIVFLTAVCFVGRKVYMEFNTKDGCAQGCAKCHISEVTKKLA
ncbi:MAG: hypothetical protein ACJA2S_004670 [Cyclobacteriaceae bacterium]|jgi:hypothetical protein